MASDPIHRLGPNGEHRFIYQEGEIIIPTVSLDKLGRLPMDIVTPSGDYLGRDMLNHRSDSDRWKLSQQAGRRDGVSSEEWADRLLAVSVKLDELVSVDWGPGATDGAWPPMAPVPTTPPVPALQESLVPEPLRPWLNDIATRACFPLEFVAVPAVIGAGSVVGRQIGIKPTRYDDFCTVPNFWGGLVARPGLMKTYAIEEGLKPVSRLAATAHERYETELVVNTGAMAQVDAEIKLWKREIEDAVKKADSAKLEALKLKLGAKQAESQGLVPIERRYMTSDATVEKLGELLRANPRGLLIKRDELAGWLRTMDKSGRDGDREFYLESWNGTGSYVADRIGRGTIHIPALCISICGGIQPGKLRHYIDEAVIESEGADGLLQRLQLLVWPDGLGEWHLPDRWPDADAKNRAYKVFESLDRLGVSPLPVDTSEGIPTLRFNDDAQDLYDDWRTKLETRLRSNELAATPAFESHIAKYRSLMPSLALVFHLVDVAVGGEPGLVSLSATQMAIEWCDFLEAHARKLYACELTPGLDGAHALVDKVKTGAVTDGQPVRDIYRHHWTGLRTSGQVANALEVTERAGWVRVESVDTGGRPAETVRLHPDLRGG